MQKVGCITTLLHSINMTCELNEYGRFSAQLGLANLMLEREIEIVVFLGNTELFEARKRGVFTMFDFCGHLLLIYSHSASVSTQVINRYSLILCLG